MVELARVGRDGADREARGALAQGVEQLRAAVERDDLVAAAGEVERDAPGPGADVEHRRALAVGQLAPQRQVEVVAAALDVVPEDLGHVNEPCTAPRATSRSRSASIAV